MTRKESMSSKGVFSGTSVKAFFPLLNLVIGELGAIPATYC
jgi:hypothetical protein